MRLFELLGKSCHLGCPNSQHAHAQVMGVNRDYKYVTKQLWG